MEAIKVPFAQWLVGFGVTPAQAETVSHRLPTYFVFALHEEWAKNSDKYACLKDELNTPFTKANQREQAWQRYSAWLQKQVEEPMFLEAFGLKQVYVSACAYYKEKIASKKEEDFERRLTEDKQYQRIVVNLENELHTWLNKADSNDAIRIVSGGPGSGKSSFAKIFAAQIAKKGTIKVLFIPLHQFNPSDDLVDSIGDFINSDIYGIIALNPLLAENAEQRLLIIFDGLDELAMQGKIAAEVAQQFVREVHRKVDRFNSRETRLQVLISGRELVVQANSSEFRQPRQILHILPYFMVEEERKNYIDTETLLAEDKRQLWWQKYSKAKGYEYNGLPLELDQGHLTEITSQPLLNYLVALSFVRGEIKFAQDSNLNIIYKDLLKAVYQRVWELYPHPSLQGIEEKDFVRILEEIALASWHGDGRTTTVKEVEIHCDNSGLRQLLNIFQEGAKLGVTRLLTAFYFRQSGFKESEKTFEFTHKSFGEYLTAKRIVHEVQLIHRKLEARKNDPDEGWDERQALKRWAILCGASPMDEYLFNFVINEIKLYDLSDVSNWQQTLCHLIGFMLRYGMPMERLNPRPDFQEENRQARNAEEALLVVLNVCARVTEKTFQIKWHSPEAFGNFISRLQGQRIDNVFCVNHLSFLDLQNCILVFKDFYRANLKKANLKGATLKGATLEGANLEGAILEGANLEGANLKEANLEEANLERANLKGANLEEANLEKVSLEKANIEGANLKGATLKGSYLKGAYLKGAYLEGANFERSNLEGGHLKEANLEGAYLEGANLEKANLEKANFLGANLVKANLKMTKNIGANFRGANLNFSKHPYNQD
uniref:pentapeptide repeat-containing protein n=1 Tax=Calothrix sp. NIES-2098 TaxID=1954171 RepID=UPI0030DCF1EF